MALQFHHAWAGAAAVAGLIVAALLRARRMRRQGVATTAAWLFTGGYRASIFRRLPGVVFILALLLVAIALMDPFLPYSETQIRSKGLDIVMAIDLSSSMGEPMEKAAVPGHPGQTRLEATKDAIRAFVDRRVDDRIGLVVFSDHAYVISPLTFDHDYLLRYIDFVDDQLLRNEGMTAIGEGLSLSDFLLTRQPGGEGRRNKVVVIFTDGDNNTGRDPLDVLAQADAANIRVHLVAVDLEGEDAKKPQVQRLLHAIRNYGGRTFNATSARDLNAASAAIDRIEKGELVSQSYRHDAPVFGWFAVPALLLLAAAFAVRALPPLIDMT